MTEPLFISTEWLANHLQEEHLRIIDIRGHVISASEPPPHYFSHRDAYDTAHIPGAVFVDWTQDIIEPNSPSNDVAAPERYAALMSRLGIDDETFVVVYDDANSMFAARFWWTLRYYGHEPVAVLAGGWDKWHAEDRPVTDAVPDITPTTFRPLPQPDLLATGESILAQSDDVMLMDVRSPDEFAGRASRADRKGRIPGAVNVPRKTLLDENGNLKSPDDLRELFASAGLDVASSEVVVYCNSGVSASFGLMALKAAGLANGRVYDGSWKDWGNDPAKPIAADE